jgi:hypothetical protein
MKLRDAIRRQRRLDRFAAHQHIACVICGLGEIEALTEVPAGNLPDVTWLLEEHHVCTRSLDLDLTVLLCLNCHRIATERLAVAGISRPIPNITRAERLSRRLLAVQVLEQHISEATTRWSLEQ